MSVVNDIDRPDVGGVAPKMASVAAEVEAALSGLAPVLRVNTDDNLCSSVWVCGSLDPRESWVNGIFENSRGFRFMLTAPGGARYYSGGPVTVKLAYQHYKLPKFRKYTGPVDKVAAKVAAWIRAA